MSAGLLNIVVLAIGGVLVMQNWPRIEAMLNDILGSFGGGAAPTPAEGGEYTEPAAGEGGGVQEAPGTEGEEGGEKAPTGNGDKKESDYARAYRAYVRRAYPSSYYLRQRRKYLLKPRMYVI